MKRAITFIAILFFATAAIPKEVKQIYNFNIYPIPISTIQETKEAYSRLEKSFDTLSLNLEKLQ